ncbi:MAG: hypothetical protein M9954_14620 [Cyclobacteriaceae bacterium]|nr:hypothetical protein [Cyclobacteriaceae bacterium]MCB0499744.1 hypothetical protein [Cyclobacteriaceae bacterium]MCB9238552.1 hypothetical protein [Flammeovirgaceae bacterium]MCO5272889.1 hypothetical protein [Cyclobacteriaceae bacterium]MCW5902403.1 hypothetical protein [Cyclobacteriaceae bacterium]
MNLKELHTTDSPLQTTKIFTPTEGVNAINMGSGTQLKEHQSKVAALLVCVTGEIVYEKEGGAKEKLLPGDFVKIMPEARHGLMAETDSTALLIK